MTTFKLQAYKHFEYCVLSRHRATSLIRYERLGLCSSLSGADKHNRLYLQRRCLANVAYIYVLSDATDKDAGVL